MAIKQALSLNRRTTVVSAAAVIIYLFTNLNETTVQGKSKNMPVKMYSNWVNTLVW